MNIDRYRTERFFIRNSQCDCCLRLISFELREVGMNLVEGKSGEIVVGWDDAKYTYAEVENLLAKIGFPVLQSHDERLVAQIKRAVIDLVQYSTYNAMVRNSDYLVERFNLSYSYLSSLFSRIEGESLEKFIIKKRIERVSQLLDENELSLSEIAFMMGYSSVQYLSTQFRRVSGQSVSDYKRIRQIREREILEVLSHNSL
ncbi:MAG: AraC family transcriptional regulator [Sphingobacteriia bacterium]|nr:AraC family transcriptional regulator [Sphingobacteriia bacterium]